MPFGPGDIFIYAFKSQNLNLGAGCEFSFFFGVYFSEELNPLFDVPCWLVIKPVEARSPNSCETE